MARTFCKTWWGNAWLQALSHIDYSNRIPRGARYARNGSVKSVVFDGNKIKAKVQGSRVRPYTVTMVINKFSESEKERLIDGILAKPAIVPQLLNMNLSPAVLDIAKEARLKVFPSSWRDLDMDCDCPDWAVPCKHIAAVVYMVGLEIDNNPFLVFQLHGVDILEELKKRGVVVDEKRNVTIPKWQDALSLVLPSVIADKKILDAPPMLDFSKITEIGDALLRILPDEPPFYKDGNFLKLYVENLGKAKRQAERLLAKKIGIADVFKNENLKKSSLSPSHDIVITMQDGLKCSASRPSGKTKVDMPKLLYLLDGIANEDLRDCADSVYVLKMCYLLALHLLMRGNVKPQIFENITHSYSILWTPVSVDSQTELLLKQMDALFPSDSIRIDIGKRSMKATLCPAWLMTSCFLTQLICGISKSLTWVNKAYRMFFSAESNVFTEIGEQSVPLSVKSWLDHLSVAGMRWRPVVMVCDEEEDAREFLLEMAVEDTKEENPELVSLRDIFEKKEYAIERFNILKDFSLLSSLVKGLDAYLGHEAKLPLSLDNAEFTDFLFEIMPAMKLLGIKLMLPKSLQTILRPRPSVKLSAKQNDGKSFLRMDQLLQFDWRIAVGDDLVDVAEFERLVGHAEGLIRFKMNYIYVSAEDLKKLEKTLASQREMTPARMLQVALAGEYKGAKVELTPEVKKLIAEWTTLKDVPVPEEIHAQLRPYQERGYAWMYHNMRLGFGSILADDMGLGKTLQVITFLQKLKDEKLFNKKHALVVAPTGLLANWQAELQRFGPSLSVFLYHGGKRDLKDFSHDILLTSYGLVRSDADQLKKQKWQVVVIDEAQNIKNNDTAQSKAVRAIKADVHIAMSGTPVENRLSEYWSIMDFANKGYLGTIKSFKEEYANPIQDFGDVTCADRFRRITSPMMMRRLKTDKTIISDLPDKIEQDEFAMLTPQQAALYKKVLDESMKVIEDFDETDSKQLFERQGIILQMMLALKQVCNHPAQYLKDGKFVPSLSGKTEMLLDLVDSIVESGEKVLIFTQFKEMGDMLQKFIEERTGVQPMFLHGGCSIKQRKEMVDRFQQNKRSDRVFILSLKAAGTGLNLTAATHVVHYDLWWNPAVEAQATDRAYRIGQKKNVMVHRFITKNTFEERINDMINNKRALAEMTVSRGENWIGKLSNKELKEIFG